MIIAFYKPFGVVSQFTSQHPSHTTLAQFKFPSNVYPVGRLDADSEGLLLLTNEPSWIPYLLEPRYRHPREYWVQVEGAITQEALESMERGVQIQGYLTRPCLASLLDDAAISILPERMPPIRFRKTIPTSWISIELTEGKNRQVRRMTATVGFPTLRLIRVRIGNFRLSVFQPGVWWELNTEERQHLLMNDQYHTRKLNITKY
ncbi:MAG: pseudouridine synthase [Bacteroidota bacterium]|nr:pseudouridine synthase [Candidatus Kapabacteria bacterium]MDW8218947.1 pseudouridine synthase [Bacteroidota bacterium]